ncbi:hypothetical protein FOZ63_000727 [Perkinsus olseni]|uniref:Uncharacterized protein n=1 Tax=Perkinsus olseni TaxID=32597 RepID=A0A7J6N6A7_PEROL|nr:hypothetical protein FOZ60_015225 [Perkinsus olseni]KAF4698664.1 hypothetical protein FOZ63_000727 [Perkinsus olseni]KAF4740367.1 hypothetical protein FOZ62_003372 [Perkinsus olseni]
MATRLIASLSSAAVVLVNAVIPTDYGNFIYQSNGSYPVKMTFNTTKEGHARFSIECERRYEAPFQLRPNPTEVDIGSIHEFEHTGSGAENHKLLLERARKACPQLSFKPGDFQWFFVGGKGDLNTMLQGDLVSLERQWMPLRSGRYVTPSGKASADIELIQKYDIYPDGYIYVQLRCEEDGVEVGSTRHRLFRLVAKDNGQHYELTAIPGRGDVVDLKESFMRACHMFDGSYYDVYFEEQMKRFKFAEGYNLFAMGVYNFDHIHGKPLSR